MHAEEADSDSPDFLPFRDTKAPSLLLARANGISDPKDAPAGAAVADEAPTAVRRVMIQRRRPLALPPAGIRWRSENGLTNSVAEVRAFRASRSWNYYLIRCRPTTSLY
jgi:hypothetical protein